MGNTGIDDILINELLLLLLLLLLCMSWVSEWVMKVTSEVGEWAENGMIKLCWIPS